MNYELIIYSFLKQYLYIKEENLLGVVFYGSSNYNMSNSSSDIDLLLITDTDKNFKGCVYIDGIKIDYNERNIYDLLKEIQILEYSKNTYLMSVFLNGSVILSKNQTVENLREEILLKKQSLKVKKSNYFYNEIEELLEQFNFTKPNSNFFNYIFYNLIEVVRKLYHTQNGYSNLPSMKVYELYSNKEYAKKFFCASLPSEEFTNLYLDLLINGYQKEKLQNLINFINIESHVNKKFNNYTKSNLKYTSTIVKNAIDKSIYCIQNNKENSMGYYYVTLEKIRKLYCRMNYIDESILNFGNNYDDNFMKLFENCLNDIYNVENLKKLFEYVTKSFNIDYNNYRILELIES